MVEVANLTEDDRPIPKEIKRANLHDIQIVWNDAHESVYPARFLRLSCPCAVCVDEMTGKRVLNELQVPTEVAPQSLEVVGRYALRIWWNDQHASGIYTFDYLRGLCPCPRCQPR